MPLGSLHLLCLTLVVGLAVGLPLHYNGTARYDDWDWDYFLFVQENPGGICAFDHTQEEKCSYPSNITTWTMHGIWPTKSGTLGPNYCNPNATFDLTVLEPLLPQLVKQWPNLEPDTPFDSFWSHEWLKHGTCASGISSMQTEKDFFTTVLNLHEKFNFTELLASQSINPSNKQKYTTSDFNDAFKNAIGVVPLLECKYSQETGQILSQLSICLQKDFTVIPCAPYVFSSSSDRCYDNEEVKYVPKEPTPTQPVV